VLAVGKTLERSNGIVTDRRDAESLFSDCIEMLLQLHELDFTERSPIRRTEKDQHGAFGSHDRFEILSPTVLVRRGKRGHLLAHLRAGLDALCVKCGDRQGQQAQPLQQFAAPSHISS
jgi:hypothetical protein